MTAPRAVIWSKGQRAAGRVRQVCGREVERLLALQEWLALTERRQVIVPFGEMLANLMPTDTMELRTRRDFDQLLS
jgi:hypothetical protein